MLERKAEFVLSNAIGKSEYRSCAAKFEKWDSIPIQFVIRRRRVKAPSVF